MAFAGKTIHNNKTGVVLRFLQCRDNTEGALLEMETEYPANSVEPPIHYHPFQEEQFEVLEGELSVRLRHEVLILKKGDRITIAKNQFHSMWNHTNAKTRTNWKVKPALETEYFLENLHGLANDGKTNEKGVPAFLQVAVLFFKFKHVFRLASPPYFIQYVLFSLLSPIGKIWYKSRYDAYEN